MGWSGAVEIRWGDGIARVSCAPVVLVSFDAVALVRRIDVVLFRGLEAVLVQVIDVVPLRTVLVECSTEEV